MFYPDLLVLLVDRMFNLFRKRKFFSGIGDNLANNINVDKSEQFVNTKRLKMLFPSIHGNYKSHFEEFQKWGRGAWSELFIESGYKIISTIKGQVHSGYGFGFDRIRKILEKLGFHSTIIFILQKND